MMTDRKPKGVRILDQNQSVKFNIRKVKSIILEGLEQKLSNTAKRLLKALRGDSSRGWLTTSKAETKSHSAFDLSDWRNRP